MPLAEEFNRFNKKSGVYILSPDFSPTLRQNQEVVVKIGLSKNLKTRLNSYHTAYRESFWTYTILETTDINSAKKLEKQIHNHLKSKGYQYVPKQYIARKNNLGNEWYDSIKKNMINEINYVLRNTDIKYKVYNLHSRYFKLV